MAERVIMSLQILLVCGVESLKTGGNVAQHVLQDVSACKLVDEVDESNTDHRPRDGVPHKVDFVLGGGRGHVGKIGRKY